MKRILLFLFSMAMIMNAFSANDSTRVAKPKEQKEHAHYLSVNGTFFLQQFLTFATQTTAITPSPYIVEYKYLPGHHGVRFGFGGNFSNKKTFLDSSQVQVNKSTSFNFRLGYIYQKNVAKHWAFFVGADMVSTINTTSFTNNTVLDVVTTKSQGYSLGAGPSFGIQFSINKRIGLFTETAFYYQMAWAKDGLNSVNFPESNNGTHSVENKLKFIIPTSIFFYVRL